MISSGDVLTSALRVRLQTEDPERFRASLSDATDWEDVFTQALEHGCAAIVCEVLLHHANGSLTAELQQACRIFLDSREQATEQAFAQLFAIFEDLESRGIEAIPLKGPCLALQAYGDVRLRGFRDLDFLIRAGDVPAVERRLIASGYETKSAKLEPRKKDLYRRINRQDIFFAPDRLPLEPHWDLGPSTLGLRLSIEAIWRRASRKNVFGREVLMLGAEDTLLSLALHGYKERWAKLVWIADIAGFVQRQPDLDWPRLMQTARAAGMVRMLCLALHLAQELLGLRLAENAAQTVVADPETRRIAAQIAASLFLPRRKEDSVYELSLYGWRMRDRFSDRLRYAARSCFATELRHLQAVDLPDRLTFAYPAVALLYDTLAKPAWRITKGMRRRTMRETGPHV